MSRVPFKLAGLAAVGLAAVGAALVAGVPARADLATPPPPVSVVRIEPTDTGPAVQVPRVARASADDADRWQLVMDVWLRNDSRTPITVDYVTIGYDGPGDPGDLVRLGYTIALPAGATVKVIVPESRIVAFPLPTRVNVDVTFTNGWVRRVSAPLVGYDSPLPFGGMAFPGRDSDLMDGQVWTTPHGSLLSSHHRSSDTESNALDMAPVTWDPDTQAWSATVPGTDGTHLEDFVGFGVPLRAPATGHVVSCRSDRSDNPVGERSHTPNYVTIEVAPGYLVSLYHLQAGSVPPAVCPTQGTQPAPGVPVSAGDLVGRLGNSGWAGTPHLHLQVVSDPDAESATGRPLLFRDIEVLDRDLWEPDAPSQPWTPTLSGVALDFPMLVRTIEPELGFQP